MLFIHFANVYLSDLTEEDPCSLWVCVRVVVNVPPTHRCTSHSVLCLWFLHIYNRLWSVTNSLCCFHRYLINFLLDATLGMLVIYGGVKAVSAVVEWRQWDSLRFGEYGMSLNISCLEYIKSPVGTVILLWTWHFHWAFLCECGLIYRERASDSWMGNWVSPFIPKHCLIWVHWMKLSWNHDRNLVLHRLWWLSETK